MSDLPVTVTNVNKWGKKTNKWFVTIGKQFRAFTEEEYKKDGKAWVEAAHQQGK